MTPRTFYTLQKYIEYARWSATWPLSDPRHSAPPAAPVRLSYIDKPMQVPREQLPQSED
jgi:hypothetical protein